MTTQNIVDKMNIKFSGELMVLAMNIKFSGELMVLACA
jgi:hypothetical protein